MAVTPDGDIYPCHQFVGKDEFKQGSVLDQSFNMDIAQKFAGMNIYSRPKCQKCWAKFYCSGGCSAANYNMNHDMNDSYDLGCEINNHSRTHSNMTELSAEDIRAEFEYTGYGRAACWHTICTRCSITVTRPGPCSRYSEARTGCEGITRDATATRR